MNSTNREVDTITAKDLPGLRAEMYAHIANNKFSDTFRAACQNVIAAIDKASDEDESTHPPLKSSLEEYVRIGNNELLLHNVYVEMLPC